MMTVDCATAQARQAMTFEMGEMKAGLGTRGKAEERAKRSVQRLSVPLKQSNIVQSKRRMYENCSRNREKK